jgi:hypothetical protein
MARSPTREDVPLRFMFIPDGGNCDDSREEDNHRQMDRLASGFCVLSQAFLVPNANRALRRFTLRDVYALSGAGNIKMMPFKRAPVQRVPD